MSNLTLDHFLAMGRAFAANMPPPMLAIKCHPATESPIRRMMAVTSPDSLPGLYIPPPIYLDATLPPGKVLVAETREIADLWRLQERMKYWQWRREEAGHLISVLRQRLAALGAG